MWITPQNLYLAWDGATKSHKAAQANELRYAASTAPLITHKLVSERLSHQKAVIAMLNPLLRRNANASTKHSLR